MKVEGLVVPEGSWPMTLWGEAETKAPEELDEVDVFQPYGVWDKVLWGATDEESSPQEKEVSSPTRYDSHGHKDHDVFARHNKFGTFQVPKTFLNFNEEAEQCALKVAEKGAAKKATKQAVATQTNQKTVLTKTDQAQTDQKEPGLRKKEPGAEDKVKSTVAGQQAPRTRSRAPW